MNKRKKDKLYNDWVKIEKVRLEKKPVNKKEESRAKRTYIHFDKRRRASSLLNMKKDIIDSKNIAKERFWPFLKFTISTPHYKGATGHRKKDVKDRDVYYAAHKDALIYSWYSFLLNEEYYNRKIKDLGIEKCVLAYRRIPTDNSYKKNKCNIHFAKEVFDYIANQDECVAFIADITGFFDNLDHAHLKKEWCSVLGIDSTDKLPGDHYVIYKNLTQFKYVDLDYIKRKVFNIKDKKKIDKKNKKTHQVPVRNNKKIDVICTRQEFIEKIVKNKLIKGNQNFNKIEKSKRYLKKSGIMQGSPISATLSNIYMMSFDKEINDFVFKHGGIYRRYSDDLVIVCKQKIFKTLKKLILTKIRQYELIINENKTKTVFFLRDKNNQLRGFSEDENGKYKYKNFQYLGFEFNGQNVFVRASSVSKYYRKMKSKVEKTVNMAYGKKSKTKNDNNKLYKKILFKKYLYNGRRSFISYAFKSI